MRKIFILSIFMFIVCCSFVFATNMLENYDLANRDEADVSAPELHYFGYTRTDNDWWIVLRTSSTSNITNYEYAVGKATSSYNYNVYWSTRAALNYYNANETYQNPN